MTKKERKSVLNIDNTPIPELFFQVMKHYKLGTGLTIFIYKIYESTEHPLPMFPSLMWEPVNTFSYYHSIYQPHFDLALSRIAGLSRLPVCWWNGRDIIHIILYYFDMAHVFRYIDN